MKYIILIKSDINSSFYDKCYSGKEYVVAHERYVVYSNEDKAKRYSSKKIAEKVANRLFDQCSNVWGVKVKEVTE